MNAAGLGNYNADQTAKTTSSGPHRIPSSYPSNYHSEDASTPSNDSTVAGEDTDVQIGNLARQLTRQSHAHHHGHHKNEVEDFEADTLFHPEKDSELDPYSPNFSAKAWATAMLNLSSRDTNNPRRRAGFAFRNLSVNGFGSDTDYQATVGNTVLAMVGQLKDMLGRKKRKVQILNNFDGLLESGEMLVVLGPPGSGCSTLLKTVASELDGIYIDDNSYLNYRGISPKQMRSQFRGEAIYTAEVDAHFPQLTVGETLIFAAEARAPRTPPAGLSRAEFAKHMRDVMMAVFGISHTVNTRVGNDFIRGVSGGERKRVTIAEAALSGAPLQCWDNSTRGLDSANAIEFCKTVRMSTQLAGSAACVAIYQSPQSAYDLFDKVTLIYSGEQCYFGPAKEARQFFIDMGFDCPEQATTPDFLTSLTSPAERHARPGWEGRVPKTPKEFAAAWKASETYAQLQRDLEAYDSKYPFQGPQYEEFLASRRAQQSKKTRPKSPYTLSYGEQVRLCLRRGFWRLKADPTLTLTQLFGNFAMALIVSSVFFNLPATTSSFYQRGALLFFAILLNAFASALEILTLYSQRPQVEKHQRYAFYHPSAEACASMLTDLPYKITNLFTFNITLYFMTNLRREAGPFFFFILISFMVLMTMSMFFRTIASVSRTLTQALAPAAVVILALLIYAGFAISVPNMLGWSSWIRWLNPVYYGLEALMINEFHGREYGCSTFVPSGPAYANVSATERICSTVGAVAGSSFVNGDAYIYSAYLYKNSNKWRNFGVLWVFLIGFCAIYLVAAENVRAKKSKGEVLVFPRGKIPSFLKGPSDADIEASSEKATVSEKLRSDRDVGDKDVSMIQEQTAIFSWEDVCYDVKIKKETRRILDHADGWVKPGTLTALMGVSGAGKTTLLDVLASRVTMGVVTGQMLVDGRQRDTSFARKTGYCMQQDLHLETSTVREALVFSAVLRQPAHISHQEKLDYVEEVIKLLEMEPYADAVVGVPGEGLNVEQRKRLTIGVELVAKPELLLFLDEPSSGLDSQTSYAIIDLLVKLKNHGQAILCTIHQPSALLFERFDRLLFLAKGGRTVYFGPVGAKSAILTAYFENNGGFPCPKGDNPAEWMLQVIGAAPGSHTDVDWPATWLKSKEREAVKEELQTFKSRSPPVTHQDASATADKASLQEFAAPFPIQVAEVTKRVWQQYWRTPSYIWSKTFLCVASALFIGFSFFKAKTSQSGLQNQLFAIFLLLTVFGQIVQQLMPLFVTQRDLYEVRERPSRTYSWRVFMLSNIVVEIPWTTLMAVLMFFCWYYPIGLYRNAEPTGAVNERGALVFLFVWAFMMFTSTFAFAVIAGINTAETGGNIANLLFSLCLIFCGVLASNATLPGFWIFMYRVSPFTYLVQGILGTALANTDVVCAANELLSFQPPSGQTCSAYMAPYISAAGGYLTNPNATADCSFCSISSTNTFLAAFNIYYKTRWRDFGLMWVYIIFNVFAALGLYWLARVPRKQKVLETPHSEQSKAKA